MFDDRTFRITSDMSEDGVLTVTVTGDLDADTSDRLDAELGKWLGIQALVINMDECTFVDSRGLSTLVACRREIGPAAPMRLVGVAASVERTLRVAGLEQVLGLEPSPTVAPVPTRDDAPQPS